MEEEAIQGQVHCPVCDSDDICECIRIGQVPVYCNVLHETREAALGAPMGEMDLRFCAACGHLFNAAFDPARVDYSSEYENSLHYSGRFRAYARSLAEDLVQRHGLHGKTIIEIACGQGDFLALLCSLGGNRGIGFDPSHVPGRSEAVGGADLTFVQDYYSETYGDLKADLVCCRHALEHMANPGSFLSRVRRAIGKDSTAVFFEVPNALFTLRDLGIWDIIYEHCGYFCAGSLRAVFRRNGFSVKRIQSEFGGQFLALHASPGGCEDEVEAAAAPDLAQLVRGFAAHYRSKVETWRGTLRRLRADGRRTVLWGAGSKGVSFVNALAVSEEIGLLVDLNPHKDGRFVPGTGHRVRTPGYLADYRPDTVLVMNPLYEEEIRRDLQDMGLSPQILVDRPR
ncbi:MAG: class I SAM-dependent methyltransferase [Chromatiaceae bacterium]|nr:class I SAM-dependent methyltransferase [Chromatiaceae bacterium]